MMDDAASSSRCLKRQAGRGQGEFDGALLATQFELAACRARTSPNQSGATFTSTLTNSSRLPRIRSCHPVGSAQIPPMLTLSHNNATTAPEIRDAVFGNVGSLVAFRVGQHDAEHLESEFGEAYPAEDSGFTQHEICAKILSAASMAIRLSPNPAPWGDRHNHARKSFAGHGKNMARNGQL